MQHEIQPSRRPPMPALCTSCGAVVTGAALSCPACGAANPTAKTNETLDFGRPPESPPSDTFHTLEAKFYRNSGETGAPLLHIRTDQPRENVVTMPQPAPPEPRRPLRYITLSDVDDEIGDDLPSLSGPRGPITYLDAEPGPMAPGTGYVETPRPMPVDENVVTMPQAAPAEPRRPMRHITLSDLEDEIGDDVPPLSGAHDPTDYLDSQLGLKAPGADHVVEEPHRVPVQTHRATAPAPRAPVVPRQSDGPGLAALAAVGVAFFAVGIAISIQLFAPDAIPGYSAAELELTVHLRAVKWLLAGVIFAIVGLLLKR